MADSNRLDVRADICPQGVCIRMFEGHSTEVDKATFVEALHSLPARLHW